MKIKFLNLLAGIALLFVSAPVFSQNTFELPEDIDFQDAEDYKNYEPTMVGASKWLEQTPLDKKKTKRAEISKFVIQWSTGSPTVSIMLYSGLMKLFKDNPDLMTIYMASYCRYCIEQQSDKDSRAASKTALVAMSTVYEKGVGVKKTKALETLSKHIAQDKLDKYVDELMK